MQLWVGLGNPGAKYKNHRHNVGFMMIDAIAQVHSFGPAKSRFTGDVHEGMISTDDGPKKILLLKPMKFMNVSGMAVQKAMQFYKIPLPKVVVFHDELDLEFGKFRMKKGGGIAGHNGLRSIREHIGSDFHRVRIGIGHPGHKDRVTNHVLSDFSKAEQSWIAELGDAYAQAAPWLACNEHGRFQTRTHDLLPAPPETRPRNRKA